MPITDIHLIGLLERLDVIRENLHLRPLTDREKEDIGVLLGFTTLTKGVYNPVNFPNRWRNVKSKPYTEESFEIKYKIPLTVSLIKGQSFKLPLSVCIDIIHQQKDSISVINEFRTEEIIHLPVIKSFISHEIPKNLKVLSLNDVKNVNTVSINTRIHGSICTPIKMQSWLRQNLITNLGVYSNLTTNVSDRMNESIYIIRDVGTISDIELLDMIETVEIINAI